MKKLFAVISVMVITITIQQLFLNLNQVVGNSPPPLKPNQLLISEKVTFAFRDPKFGDIVIFHKEGNDYSGVVVYASDKTDPKPYKVVSKDGGDPWELTKSDIKSLVWYPELKIGYQDGSDPGQ